MGVNHPAASHTPRRSPSRPVPRVSNPEVPNVPNTKSPSNQNTTMVNCELPLLKWGNNVRLKSGTRTARLLRLYHLPLIVFLVTIICTVYLIRCTATFPKPEPNRTVVAGSGSADTTIHPVIGTTGTISRPVKDSTIDTSRTSTNLDDGDSTIDSTRASERTGYSPLERTHTETDPVEDTTNDDTGTKSEAGDTGTSSEAGDTGTNSEASEESTSNFVEKKYDSIFFLKTHKTGSSTISELLFPYARRHNLTTFSGSGDHLFRTPNTGDVVYDAIVGHHFVFDWNVVNSYLRQLPNFILTNIRLPLQRQLSWFRQQNRELDDLTCKPKDTPGKNRNVSLILDKFDSFFKEKKQLGAQFDLLRERSVRPNALDEAGIINQFTFIILRERFVDSLECLCSQVGVRLCDNSANGKSVKSKNVSKKSTCVETMLLKYRSSLLIRSSARDVMMYEIVNDRLNKCMQDIPQACKCLR